VRIKNIKVSGFKSFCHPVNLKIKQNGVTIVVGPNGCGKSNVVDAVRWVLGEQRVKHLRGGAMEDVIFSGTSFQKPSGVAEVSLTFSNPKGDTLSQYADYTEISVSRKLYRSGESIYMINKTPVRLKDIRELFMDTGIGSTGYSIIEQGRVGEIVSAKPGDRRTLVDDAAGVVKFRFKRENAEKRLTETTQNLLRITDVLGTLTEQEMGLREHVEKAEKYLDIKEKCEFLELQHLCLSIRQLNFKEEKTNEIVQDHQQKHDDLQNEKSIVETEMESLKLEQTQRGVLLRERREELFKEEQKIQSAENQRTLEKQNLQNILENQDNYKSDLEKLKVHFEEVKNEITNVEKNLKKFSIDIHDKRKDIEKIEKTQSIENDKTTKLNEKLSYIQKNLLHVHTELTNQKNQKNFIDERIENLTERHQRLQDQEKSHKNLLNESNLEVSKGQERLQEIDLRKKKLSENLKAVEDNLTKKTHVLNDLESNCSDLIYQKNTAKSRSESLQQIQKQYEGLSDSVKMLMQLMYENPETKKNLGIVGVLADFVDVSKKITDSVSTVIAEVLDWVIIEKTVSLQEIELFCEKNELGRINFLPMDLKEEFPENQENIGKSLNNLLKFNPPAEDLCEKFFARFSLLNNEKLFWSEAQKSRPLAPFERISPNGVKITSTIISIGKSQSGSLGFLQRQQQITEVEEFAENLQKKIQGIENKTDTLGKEFEELKNQKESEEEELRKLEFEYLSCKKEVEHYQFEERRTTQTVSQISRDSTSIFNEMDSSKKKVLSTISAISRMSNELKKLEQEKNEIENLIKVQNNQTGAISEKLLSLRINLTEISEQEKNLEETEKRLKLDFKETSEKINFIEKNFSNGIKKVEESNDRINEIDSSFDGMLEKRSKLEVNLNEEINLHEQKNEEQNLLTQKLQERQISLEKAVEVTHQESLKVAELRIQREQLEKKLVEITDKSSEDILADSDFENSDIKQLGEKFRTLKSRLSVMGPVNLSAPEEYAELKERINFLKSQSEDLQKAIDDLKETIKDINNESRRRFKEMFDLINDNFKNVFTKLFEGGEAKLLLTESEDLLNAGVDIMAQPPGKKLQNINLLSGGEKALTAISLIFAIFLVKPSPFCFLDEVDAPLDDVNIVRFNRLISSLSYDSQFILITHNKKTMEIGELLYGVTMEEPGISKTVSVEFKDAQRLIA
tara:strand:- start:309 stop:3887 length:3579 start_codon:yes stop_codon:yes gene_type:complete